MITTINKFKILLESKQIKESFENKNGILVYPKHFNEKDKMGEILDNSEWYAEWDARDGYYFIEEENNESFDIIIDNLEELFDENNISYEIEPRYL